MPDFAAFLSMFCLPFAIRFRRYDAAEYYQQNALLRDIVAAADATSALLRYAPFFIFYCRHDFSL